MKNLVKAGLILAAWVTGTPAWASFSNCPTVTPVTLAVINSNVPAGCQQIDVQFTNFAVGTPNALFINPPGYGVKFGSLGRNVFRAPWFNGLDAALLKNIRVRGEGIKLQIRGEALNILNHPNFDGIVTNLNDSRFGRA